MIERGGAGLTATLPLKITHWFFGIKQNSSSARAFAREIKSHTHIFVYFGSRCSEMYSRAATFK